MAEMVNVAVDAMGGDYAPVEIVKGAIEAVNLDKRVKVFLVGREEAVKEELKKYTFDASLGPDGGWKMDSVYGLAVGETTRPVYATKENGWQAKDIFNSDSKGYVLGASQYPLYTSEEQLESRQYWPIFKDVVATSNGTLWNNYGY